MATATMPGTGFFFLFRTDQGRIDRTTWWRGTLPLAALAVAGTLGWWALSPYAHHDLSDSAFIAPLTIVAYVYLLLYAFALILIGVCEYNLSAKRFRDRGLPAALAAALPLSLLFGSALVWFIPQSFDTIPAWAGPVTIVLVLAVAAWNVVELGLRRDAAAR